MYNIIYTDMYTTNIHKLMSFGVCMHFTANVLVSTLTPCVERIYNVCIHARIRVYTTKTHITVSWCAYRCGFAGQWPPAMCRTYILCVQICTYTCIHKKIHILPFLGVHITADLLVSGLTPCVEGRCKHVISLFGMDAFFNVSL
jgi:hypothetical protein